jgi:hypothetical protein
MEENGTYSRWDITDLGNGMAHIRYETNDNDDDGSPDPGPPAVLEKNVKLACALDCAGKSRIGYYGHPVDVYLNGIKI